MISSFDLKYDFSEEMNAIVVENSELNSNYQRVKLFIPTIMNGIQKGDPTISILSTLGKSVFCNADKKPILTNPVLREQNYLESSINSTSNVNDLDSTIRSLTNEEKQISYNIPKNATVRAQFLNGKVSKLSFNTTKETNATVTVIENKKI